MQTIDEAAKECAFCAIGNQAHFTHEQIFKHGVFFANDWIAFEKELPTVGIDILLKSKNGNTTTYIPKNSDGIKWCSEKFILWRPVERQ